MDAKCPNCRIYLTPKWAIKTLVCINCDYAMTYSELIKKRGKEDDVQEMAEHKELRED